MAKEETMKDEAWIKAREIHFWTRRTPNGSAVTYDMARAEVERLNKRYDELLDGNETMCNQLHDENSKLRAALENIAIRCDAINSMYEEIAREALK